MRGDAAAERTVERPSAVPPARNGSLRQISEWLISLAAAVVMFRTFAVEGYMISTGSMAPHLYGYTKRVRCPSCGYRFAFGVAYDRSVRSVSAASKSADDLPVNADVAPDGRATSTIPTGPPPGRRYAVCPNCGQEAIDVSSLPRTQGDQLLVHKNAYQFRSPRRWEVVVFRNPGQPTQAYVKRVVGLPGETVRIVDGDVYADGVIQRKTFSQQRAIRIPVYDHNHAPRPDTTWQPRWVTGSETNPWTAEGHGFVVNAVVNRNRGDGASSDEAPWSLLTYRHWIRSGGGQRTTVVLRPGYERLKLPHGISPTVTFDPQTRRLSCRGALSAASRDNLLALSHRSDFAESVQRLYAESHLAPVTDVYGYNRPEIDSRRSVVRDLMMSLRLEVRGGQGTFRLQMTDGWHMYNCDLSAASRTVSLRIDDARKPVRSARLRAQVVSEPLHIEMSLMDRQVLVAVNGQQVFSPWNRDATDGNSRPPRRPVRIGVRNLSARVDDLELFRDVYYTRKNGGRPFKLSANAYYVLGDNSPVSFDSRSWNHPAVTRDSFIGKPFLVHLPSRPGKIRLGRWKANIRVPDFSRIHYIR